MSALPSFIFCDPKQTLTDAWMNAIEKLLPGEAQSRITVFNGKLSDYHGTFDCIVSPANSYSRLDGSFDLIISDMFSPQQPERVTQICQKVLHRECLGYQIPGTCLLIGIHELGGNKYKAKYIAHAPTMRFPSRCVWNREIVYNCMWSILNEVDKHNQRSPSDAIKTVFITGLGTGIGMFPVETCAEQMVLALKHFIGQSRPWKELQWRDIVDKFSMDIEETNRTAAFVLADTQ